MCVSVGTKSTLNAARHVWNRFLVYDDGLEKMWQKDTDIAGEKIHVLTEAKNDVFIAPSLHFTSLHFTSLHFTSLHFTSLHFTSLHFTSLHFTSLHFTSLHFTSIYGMVSTKCKWISRCIHYKNNSTGWYQYDSFSIQHSNGHRHKTPAIATCFTFCTTVSLLRRKYMEERRERVIRLNVIYNVIYNVFPSFANTSNIEHVCE